MSIQHRPMQMKDIPKCVGHVAAHPVLGPRYGKLIDKLPSTLRFALANAVTWFEVFEELEGSATRFLGALIAAFVSDDFLHELKTAPMFWIGPELVKRIANDKSPLLSEAQVRDANSTAGVNLLAWHATFHPRDILRGEVATTGMTVFDRHYRGFWLREIVGQADCLEHYRGMRNGGGLYFDRVQGAYASYPELNARNFSDEPRICGLTRDRAFAQGTTWLASLFVSYAPPRLGLSRSEQRLLLAARDGATDEELSERLGISIHAVKMRWRMIYDRAEYLHDLVAHSSRLDGEMRGRGREKKHRLLDYVRNHPEELRPVSLKLLRRGPSQGTELRSRSVL